MESNKFILFCVNIQKMKKLKMKKKKIKMKLWRYTHSLKFCVPYLNVFKV